MTAPLTQPPPTIEGIPTQPAGTVFKVAGEQVITLVPVNLADERIWEWSLTWGRIHSDRCAASATTATCIHCGLGLTLLPSGQWMHETGSARCIEAGPLRWSASGRLVPEWPEVEHRPMPEALTLAAKST